MGTQFIVGKYLCFLLFPTIRNVFNTRRANILKMFSNWVLITYYGCLKKASRRRPYVSLNVIDVNTIYNTVL